MPRKFSGPKHEREQKKRKFYERKVLQHLKDHGPQSKDSLIVLLDQPRNTGNIGIAIEELIAWKYVERKDGVLAITNSGVRLLKDTERWT
jgi:hypothetical protein